MQSFSQAAWIQARRERRAANPNVTSKRRGCVKRSESKTRSSQIELGFISDIYARGLEVPPVPRHTVRVWKRTKGEIHPPIRRRN